MNCRTRRKRGRTKRIKRHLKISWQKLGIEALVREKLPTPIEEIRREVIRLASQGMKQRVVRPASSPAVSTKAIVRRRRRSATQ